MLICDRLFLAALQKHAAGHYIQLADEWVCLDESRDQHVLGATSRTAGFQVDPGEALIAQFCHDGIGGQLVNARPAILPTIWGRPLQRGVLTTPGV